MNLRRAEKVYTLYEESYNIIVFSFKKESFVTHVDLTGIEFRPGIYELTDAFDYDTKESI